MAPIKAAIIGYGISGRLSHAYGLSSDKRFEIVAVCDLATENRERAAKELNCKTYSDYHSMIREESLDIVSVVTRSDTHADIVCDCLKAGLHTVITKPWALNQEEARTMIAAQEASGKKIFPWIPMYWAPDYICIRGLLAENVIGDVFLIRRYYSDFRYRDDWQTEKRFGGGYLLNWGMHILQPIIGLAESKVKRVFGQLQQVINAGDADDNFLAVLEFENSVRGIAEFTESVHRFPSFIIQGKRGTIISDGETVTVKQANPNTPEEIETQEYPLTGKQFGDEAHIYEDIANHLLDGKPFQTPPELALEGTVVLDAVSQSHETRQTVEIP
ncbi:Gfo/Idh/MocA family oxidoreductase [Opitutia bacterium ISCC 51]|nr:Gfo/Idh/MocA family oxidoreductase [Opitutae bacterium ISCC 51]QXD29551.1 Gfo/Idh/MocA family oxidoreductase [Opitutae bacterium ISCC 52]